MSEVNIYINAPPGKAASDLIVNIRPKNLQVGLRGNDRFFINEATFSKVDTTESSWYLDSDGRTIHIVLIKAHRGELWESALLGFDGKGLVDPMTKEQIKKDMMLERFQEENPGFDFRGATFNGEAPDARSYMGGIKYS